MLFIHPIVQACLALLALYNLYLGIARFRFNHLGAKTVFRWKRHVTTGLIVAIGWPVGGLIGLLMTWSKWSSPTGTGWHFTNAVILVCFLLFQLITGLYMDRNKAKRRVLPLAHGTSGVIIILLALCQASTGWNIIRSFI
jgi:hypothetical protein